MIEFGFKIKKLRPKNIPPDSHSDLISWDKKLSENWAAEIQITKGPNNIFFEIWADLAWSGCDHAGPRFELTFFNWYFNFNIYNVNHWNWDEGRFMTKAEALAEYEEERQWQEKNKIEPYPGDKLAKWIER
jgi:hypothetical protein